MGLKKKKKKKGGGGLEVGGALKKREVIGDKGEILILEALLSMESLYWGLGLYRPREGP